MDVSIIIVNYNTKSLLKNCIKSIYKFTKDISFEIIVSDNGSTDGSIEMIKSNFTKVIVVENKENLGFGKANNRGLKVATGKYIFYLNSDTVLLNNAVRLFFDYFESHSLENIGAIGCNLVDNNLTLTHSFGTFPCYKNEVTFHLKNAFKLLAKRIIFTLGKSYKKENAIDKAKEYYGEVDYITGADLFVKNNEYAYFDERYFLYYEETDLQLNMARNSLKRKIINGPKIQHLCLSLNKPKNDIELEKSFSHLQSEKSSVIYFRKNFQYGKIKSCLLLRFAIKMCWLFAGVKNESLI